MIENVRRIAALLLAFLMGGASIAPAGVGLLFGLKATLVDRGLHHYDGADMFVRKGVAYYRYGDGTALPAISGGDDDAARTKVLELKGEHDKLIVEVKEARAKYQGEGKGEMPAEENVAMLKKLDRGDEISTEIDGLNKQLELSVRTKEQEDFTKKGTGHVPLSGNGDHSPDALAEFKRAGFGPVEVRAGYLGCEVKGKWVDVYQEDELTEGALAPLIKATTKEEYLPAWKHYMRAIDSHSITAKEWEVLSAAQVKALSEGDAQAGGFLVPTQFVAQLIMRKPGTAVVRSGGATVIAASGDRGLVPRVKAATTDATMYSSAVVVTDVAENPAELAGEIDPVFEQVGVNIHNLKMLTKLSRNLVADAAFDVTAFLTGEYAKASELGMDDRFLTGDGLNRPTGIVNDGDITQVNTGDANDLTADGIKDLVYALAVQYLAGSTIVLSLDALKDLRKLKDSQNRYLWEPGFPGGIATAAPPTIEGRPYMVTDFLDTVAANNLPMFIGDLAAFWIFERSAFAVEVLRELYAPQNQIGYVAFKRYSGVVAIPEAFRIHKVSA